MAYNDAIMNADDRQKVQALSDQWFQYKAAGDTAGMQNAHAQAEAIRGKYGYSGGAGGDSYIQTGTNTVLKSATSQADALNDVYDKRIAADQAALDAAHNQKMLDFDYAAQQIAPIYNEKRADTSAQHQLGQRNMAERFNAMGLGNGAQGQMYLSENNAYLKNMNALNAAEAKARQDIEFERTKAKAAYQDAIAQAIMDGDADRAKALYEEAVRVDNSLVSTSSSQIAIDLQKEATDYNQKVERAESLAKYGDFSGYAALGYSADEIAGMRKTWEAMNPDIVALMNGGVYAAGGGSGGGGGGRSGGGSGGSGSGGNGGNGSNSKVSAGTTKGTAQYIGTQKQKDKSSLNYSPDEGIFTWNGKNYNSTASLQAALNKTALTDAEAQAIEKKYKMYTGGTLGLS